jgi:AcrR family transcriptional regulator
MATKIRAVADEDKVERRHALLDAAEALFLEHPDRMASVAEVAQAAGLAKGTVYLYFPSKEEMLLALHERQVGAFFSALIALLEGYGPAGFDEIWALTRDHMIRPPGYLPLASRCFGLMDRDIPAEAALAYKARVAQAMALAGGGLERRFPSLGTGGGVTLLHHSYGLIVGLWQLLHPIERFGSAMARKELALFRRDYEREIEQALRTLWSGAMGPEPVRAA